MGLTCVGDCRNWAFIGLLIAWQFGLFLMIVADCGPFKFYLLGLLVVGLISSLEMDSF